MTIAIRDNWIGVRKEQSRSRIKILLRLFAEFEATSTAAVPFPKLVQLDVIFRYSDLYETAIEQKPVILHLMERRTKAGARVLNLEDIAQTITRIMSGLTGWDVGSHFMGPTWGIE